MSDRESVNQGQFDQPESSIAFEGADPAEMSPDDLHRLVHRLQVRQAELEAQNRELLRSQEELNARREKYARLYENAPVACLTVDEHCQIVEANVVARAMFEATGAPLRGSSLASLLAPESREDFVELCQSVLKNREGLSCEVEFVLEHGRQITALLEGAGVQESNGSPLLYLVVTDVSERKAAETMLRESHERLRLMFELSREGILILDSQMRFVYANPAAGHILGCAQDHLLQMNAADLRAAPGRPAAVDQLRGFSETEIVTGEFCVVRSDDEVRIVEYCGRGLSDGHYVVFMRDITDQRTAAEHLLQYSEHLEDLVELRAERIRELERNRVQSEQLASTGRMAARIAHEINNPLAGIKNSFLLVKDGVPVDYPYYRYVGAIEKEIDRIAKIVSQMFDLYQPEQEQPQRFNLGETMEDVILMLEPLSRQRGVTVAARLPDYPVILFQPEGLVRQVLYNLIANAIESSPAEETVRVTAVPLAESVSIAVSDHGAGITEEVASHLFEPFFTTKRAGAEEGVGLGLSVSRTLVELMRGSLSYQSKVGEGTVFRMVLPQSV